MSRTYLDREVTKETFALGIAGSLTRDGAPETPPQSLVTFQCTATVGAIKHKFVGSSVEETTILTIDPETFDILDVAEKVADPTLLDGEDGDGEDGGE